MINRWFVLYTFALLTLLYCTFSLASASLVACSASSLKNKLQDSQLAKHQTLFYSHRVASICSLVSKVKQE